MPIPQDPLAEITTMFDMTAQTQLAQSGAALARSYAMVSVLTIAAAASQSLTLWSTLLASGAEPRRHALAVPVRPPLAAAMPAVERGAPTDSAEYSSFRSAGGHASAQVVMGKMPAPLASDPASLFFAPMQSMLGVWRQALGA